MNRFVSKFSLFALLTANLLLTISVYSDNAPIAYSSDDERRDEEIRDSKWRDERRREDERDRQWRDERRRDEDREHQQREDRRREEQRNRDTTSSADGERVKPVRNLHPELQIAAPRNRSE